MSDSLTLNTLEGGLDHPEVQLNLLLNAIKGALAGRLLETGLTGGTITLDTDEAKNTRMEFSGTLTSNLIVVVPANGSARSFTVVNATTGSFTLTVKLDAMGSTGVIVPQGTTQQVQHDGTNVYGIGQATKADGTIPSCRVYNSANISIPNNTETALTADSERWDTDSIHSTSSNTGRLTCRTPGKYTIFYTLFFASNSTGYRYCYVRLNGATALNFDTRSALSGQATALSGSTEYQLAIGDYVEVMVLQTSGGSLNVSNSANNSPEFGMTRLSA